MTVLKNAALLGCRCGRREDIDMTELRRRDLLLSLIAVGAGYALSWDAKPALVDVVWKEASADPWYFEVSSEKTIIDPSISQPEIWEDVFDFLPDDFDDPQSLIREVEACEPLRHYFMDRAESEREDLESQLDDDDLSDEERERLSTLVKAMEDPDFGWQEWVERLGPTDMKQFQDLISEWLTEEIDWLLFDSSEHDLGGQGHALKFFESLGAPVLRTIGVKIVEGEHPGSSYYAAELRMDMDTANAAAASLGLPIRFRTEQAK
jgi:hypothetical protein